MSKHKRNQLTTLIVKKGKLFWSVAFLLMCAACFAALSSADMWMLLCSLAALSAIAAQVLDNRYIIRSIGRTIRENRKSQRDLGLKLALRAEDNAKSRNVVTRTTDAATHLYPFGSMIDFLRTSNADGAIHILGTQRLLALLAPATRHFTESVFLIDPNKELPFARAHSVAAVAIDFSAISPESHFPRNQYYWLWLRSHVPIVGFSSRKNPQDYAEGRVRAASQGILTVLSEEDGFVIIGRRFDIGSSNYY
ncbi:MAG: hypothetical protein PUK40_02100 [Actinomycetaceae bacterium]|nr:hypothetical protein [Arcanobacterium sp.]MDD7504733.1 hypothetical protein [Actinomycetaceae bacterium]MDY6143092.1 hypothetical protein [Arcanobacterium sp.]